MTSVHLARGKAALAAAALFAAGLAGVAVTAPTAHAATTHRVLFDDAHAETAGNADWIISTSIPDPLAQNANPTKESDWTGALSAWGVALQKTGDYSLKTSTSALTYGTGSALDLTNFDTVVIDEPNTLFTTAEKTALMNFVKAGGGLFLVSDHTGSDRNNDGYDSPAIINDLMTNNSVDSSDPFGFSVDLLNITKDTPKAITDASNPILHGAFGTVTGSNIYNGTTFTLKPSDNSSVKGLLYRTGYSGNTGAFFVTSTFGSGRVAVIGDSSPFDDGTGQPGNTLEDGWDDPTGTNAPLALNATAWLASGSGATAGAVNLTNPGSQSTTVGTAASLQLTAGDTAGGTLSYSATGLPAGLSLDSSTGLISGTPTTTGSYSVTATATDSTGPTSSAAFTWTVSTAGSGGGCTSAQLLGNAGFETGSASPWTVSGTTVYSGSTEPAHSGSYAAWLDGYGTTTTDTLAQSVALPSGCSSYTASFYLHIDTAETGSTAYDTLKVQVLNSSGTVLGTLATFSNTNAAGGYTQHSYSLASYAGQTVTLKFTGAEDYTKQTSFVVDDAAVNVG
ncbi:putative Ig domain-containing protein [Streptacidiphilus carbonis]|uniref:putative Ig domain-containing protein n=1 Tax=Streptacidiphilus carbonis TaxID=105422 RepID=UPI0006938537|nr:putative Ig domain-containing protein [Streptacidiphilus carbonis]